MTNKSLLLVFITWILAFLCDIQACSSFAVYPKVAAARPQQAGSCSIMTTSSDSNTLKQRAGKNPTATSTRIIAQTQQRGGAASTSTTTTTTTTRLSMMATTTAVFDNAPFWAGNGVILAMNALGLVISWMTGSHIHLDLIGTGAFLVAGVVSAVGAVPDLGLDTNARIAYSCGAVSLWSIRLAGFLFYRAFQLRHDGRLTTTLATPVGTAFFWFFSALWGILTPLAHTLGTTNAGNSGTPLTNTLGMTLFAMGWIIETAADVQKWTFKQNNPGTAFCNVGLWQYTQHPNWFGNLVLWSGIFLLNAPALIEPPTAPSSLSWAQTIWSYRRLGLALLSPLFLYTLFSGQANGTITDALQMSNRKYGYGTNDAYTDYVNNTPLIFPIPKHWFSS